MIFIVASFSLAKSNARVTDQGDLESLAKGLNPAVGFYDPLGLADGDFWGSGNEATIGFLREAEVKHGRIAMFAFVGYIVHANGITWPWPMTLDGDAFPTGLSPPEAWDAIPDIAKLQIFWFVGFLEFVSKYIVYGIESIYRFWLLNCS